MGVEGAKKKDMMDATRWGILCTLGEVIMQLLA